jgi:hypothetical protein
MFDLLQVMLDGTTFYVRLVNPPIKRPNPGIIVARKHYAATIWL